MFQIITQQRPTLRWKEWIPLFSQQLRLRNLIQIIAFNIQVSQDNESKEEESPFQTPKNEKESIPLYYYTLHSTMMSAPFYTSEKLSNTNPKWNEIDPSIFTIVNSSTNVIIIRLWLHCGPGRPDRTLSVWAVYLNGLMYLGPKISTDPTNFTSNTLVFHLVGGYFTAYEHLKVPKSKIRQQNVILASCLVRSSYSRPSLDRLITSQSAIIKEMSAVESLRQKISLGCFTTLNEHQQQNSHIQHSQHLQQLTPKMAQKLQYREELNRLRKQIELVKFRVQLLTHEKARKEKELTILDNSRNALISANQQKVISLTQNNEILQQNLQEIKIVKEQHSNLRDNLHHIQIKLALRRKQLISDLSFFYPIQQLPNNQYTISQVILPNSEDFEGHDDIAISVALGYVAHVLHMISYFLQVPLRYPIIYFGSRSKIIDLISEQILDNEREFPLFSRGREKLQFNYAVYLLNKNIAQLRWYCNETTTDLRATLPNLKTMLQLRPSSSHLTTELIHRATSGSSLDLRSSSRHSGKKHLIQRPQHHFMRGHRISKSMGSSELKFEGKISDPEISSEPKNKTLNPEIDVNQEFYRRRNRSRFHHMHPIVVSSESPPNETTTLLTRSLDNGMDKFEQDDSLIDFKLPLISGVDLECTDSEEALRVSIGEEASPEALLEAWQSHICSDDEGPSDSILVITSPNEHQSLLDDCQRVESLFATVATRTAALSSGRGSFNLVRSKNNSSAEDAFSS